tara:strand:- start:19187 stop:19786 length:600 start_codon:yes stop_codon:yes gene_type:complete
MKIAQGAEAIITKDSEMIIKERFSKAYRLPHLDESLRKFRTRREAKVLGKLNDLNFPAPKVKEFSDQRMSIVMDFVPGEKLKDVLMQSSNFSDFAEQIGQNLAKLHRENIVHGDLTTSNMIVHKETGNLHFIDFGLSSFSERLEDKAVDLFLLDRSLEATHFEHYPEIFAKVIEGYDYPGCKEVLQRLEAVKKRGRNKK